MKYKILWLLSFLCLLMSAGFPISVKAQKLIEVCGFVKNIKNKKPVGNASITIPGTNIGTVSNAEGYFTLKIPENDLSSSMKIDQIGYQVLLMPVEEAKTSDTEMNIYLTPTGKVLEEVLVLGGDPKQIVELALRKIPENYSSQKNLFSGFYRETVQKGKKFISISEAIVDVLKNPYTNRNIHGEKVSIRKGRTLMSPNKNDTLSVKLMGGPYMPLALDAVKNGDHLFTIDEINNFDFRMQPATMIDDRPHYAISFEPKVSLSYPLNHGTLFIDGETFSISRVEFSLDMKDKGKVSRFILQKKPGGLNFKPLEVSGIVTYKLVDGKSYINYISSKMRFKCDWKKRLFSSTYTSNAEMVMVDRENNVDKKLKLTDKFGQRGIFSDKVGNYWDENFWADYNIIEPTQSLEKAINKLKKD